MSDTAVQISESTAAIWSVSGGLIAFAVLFFLPELLRQIKRERKTGVAYRMTLLSTTVGVTVLLVVIAGSVGVAEVLDPCRKGDAWLGDLGSVSLVSGLLGLTDLGLGTSTLTSGSS